MMLGMTRKSRDIHVFHQSPTLLIMQSHLNVMVYLLLKNLGVFIDQDEHVASAYMFSTAATTVMLLDGDQTLI